MNRRNLIKGAGLGAAAGTLEQHLSDGAAALLIGNDGVAVEIETSYTISADMPDFFRANDDTFVRAAEERLALEQGYNVILPAAVAGVLQKAGLDSKKITRVCYPGPYARRHQALGKRMGFMPEQVQDSLYDTVGNTGAALPLMILIAAAIVVSLQTVGVALMVAMLVTPAATAYLLTRNLPVMMVLAAVVASAASVVGLYTSYYLNIASGAAIVLACTAIFGVTWGVNALWGWWGRKG